MKTKPTAIILTSYLIVYAVICDTGISVVVSSLMAVLSPFLLVCSVYFILKDNTIDYPELKKDEEWGYRDKAKEQLGTF
jgi:hypothetical protein